MQRKLSTLVVTLLAAALLAGCSGQVITQPELNITEAWVRPAPMVGGNGAAFLTIRNRTGSSDALIGADADFASAVEIHQTMQMEGDTMQMQPVERIDIPAGESVELAPGGYHIMLIVVQEKLEAGDFVNVTLQFEKAGSAQVPFEVREQ